MASGNHWEVVSNSKKAKPLNKKQKKNFVENMPTVAVNAPLDPDETIYSKAFIKDDSPSQFSSAASKVSNGVSRKPAPQKKKKNENGKKLEKPVPMDEAIAKIEHADLDNILKDSQIRFPDNQDVWLKDLASFLNIKLDNVGPYDPTFKGKPQGYPFSMLHKNCQKVLNSAVATVSNQTLDHVYYYCIQAMLYEASKDQPILGFKIFLQFLAQYKSDIALGKVHQYLELLKTHQNRPTNCLSILWAIGQCGIKNFNCGLKVWLDLMLPALEVRQVAHFPVEYIEMLTTTHKNVSNAYGIVTTQEYFQVMDIVFCPSFNLANDLKKRLVAVYPNIRTLAYGDTPAQNLRTFFPLYLSRLDESCNRDVRNELLKCLVGCLSTDQQSYSVWVQLYTKHLNASGMLLEYMDNNWSTLSTQFNKKLLRDTVRSFAVTNDEYSPGKANKEGLLLASIATKELEAKMTHSGFPWGLLIFFFLSVIGSIVTYDIMSAPELRASKTMRFLEHYGVLSVMEQAWTRINTFLAVGVDWLKANLPIYYAYVRDAVGPVLTAVWVNLKDFVIQVEIISRPYRAWLWQKMADLYQQIYDISPESWAWFKESFWMSLDVLKDYTLWIWKHSLHLVGEFKLWLLENVFVGSLSKESIKSTIKLAVSGIRHFITSPWCCINDTFLGLMKNFE